MFIVILFLVCSALVSSYRYDPAYVQHNLNQNETAVNPLDYWGEWKGHRYTPSPENWRMPFYTIFIDRFVNGDPENDNINGTDFEHDINSNQMRHGGDLQGLVDSLDYIQGMGVRALYLAGSPFINQPWGYDQYSPLDLSILEPHFGTIDLWRTAIDEIHARGMYVVLDNTFATLGDLIGFDGYLNTTTPFRVKEHHVQWKSDRHYWDFDFGNSYNASCDYPAFWNETGFPIDADIAARFVGCYNSEFDQYGDTEAFGVYPDYRREITKFASVQDRLREWYPPVRAKLENFYCMMIAQLDIDGYRYDKATQSTVDAMGYMNDAMRSCARRYGKTNFFTPGEITGGNDFGSIFLGRGRQPNMLPKNITQAAALRSNSSSRYFIRDSQYGALDSAAFHYTTYRTLTRFLGMDGNLAAGYDAPLNWVDQWNTFLVTNDFVNAETGEFDPRHMYGVTNQDVFRWPAIKNGTERQLLGHFITTMLMPGMPLLLWGEEQAFYVLDNTADNYIFGRQPMSTATAWQTHGCYSLDSAQYYEMPLDAARHGCTDDTVSYDHRDPSAPVRNILKHMFQLREAFPVLNDGMFLQQLSNQTWDVLYPGSSGVVTETGMWSVMRSAIEGVQDERFGRDDIVWLLYSNYNNTMTYEFNCGDNATDLYSTALIAPWSGGITVKNLFYPFDEHTLVNSTQYLGIDGSTRPNGCLRSLDMVGYDYRAYVPIRQWIGPGPMITKFKPGHDARLVSKVDPYSTEDIEVELQFSVPMDCDSVTRSITLDSTTELAIDPEIDRNSVKCGASWRENNSTLVGAIQSGWAWTAKLNNVANGVHRLTVQNASAADGNSTNAVDRFLFRVGQPHNPIVFPRNANYSTTLLTKLYDGTLLLNHSAAGADLYRYSTNFMSSFSDWMPYQGGMHGIENQKWSGTKLQAWDGEHVRVEYYSRLGGSSDHVQQGDLGTKARRFPHLFLNGPYNYYGYDAGLNNEMTLVDDYTWKHHWMVEWSNNGSLAQINVWGMNPDGQPDQTYVMGDADGDSVLDRLPPSSLSAVVLNITQPPPKPHLSWQFIINDGNMRFQIVPAGSMWTQLALYILLATIPIISAAISAWAFIGGFYKIKFNEIGIQHKAGLIPLAIKKPFSFLGKTEESEKDPRVGVSVIPPKNSPQSHQCHSCLQKYDALQISSGRRRKVLIATMEYDIEDWNIKVKIGGLGVMAQLMGKNLSHQDLIWVIPCVGGIEYPTDKAAEPMVVTILGTEYEVNVQYHVLRNITYVLLDAPVFRQQTKSEPYPARMDDMTSAVYYSAWNQCIAQALTRFSVDLYHINDYHGTIAPLYLLPRSFPVCLSLHNAEFQGLWPMRTKQERKEVCSVFNLPEKVVQEYVQFGEIFNLLHAGASLLRVYQEGFGAVGVSTKYGKRAFSRYPIFWGLQSVQGLPNPDPTDTGEWDKKLPKEADMRIDPTFEKERLELRIQAQKWAGLEENPAAELFVFVGRWSNQKGIDLIADVFPAILESDDNVQLICVGPVIDLYGKFAALKLDKLMKLYPKRVFSKPEFTALPPYIFSGAEFALIPSRDEPFGLVAVEFGRKGALGVGARVGGLGQMPGWWFTVESMTTDHLLHQFREAIHEAMSAPMPVRAKMRARSAKQRFPVAQWVEDLEILQSTSIRIYNKVQTEKRPGSSAPTLTESHQLAITELGDHEDQEDEKHSKHSSDHSQTSEPVTMDQLLAAADQGDQRESGQSTPAQGESRPVSLNFSKLHKPAVYKEATFGTRHGPGHASKSPQGDGDSNLDLVEPKTFLGTTNYQDDEGIGEPAYQRLSRNRWRIGGDDSDSEVSSLSDEENDDSDDEDDNISLSSLLVEEFRVAVPADRPKLVDRTSWHPQDTEMAHWPLSLQRLPSRNDNIPDPEPQARTQLQIALSEEEAITALPIPPIPQDDEEAKPRKSRSMISIDTVVGERKDFNLQKVDPFFTDSNGHFYEVFRKKLETLDKNNSETSNCIEEFLIKSEKQWFNDFRNAKLGRHSRPSSIAPKSRPTSSHRPNSSHVLQSRPQSLAPSSILRNRKGKATAETSQVSEVEPDTPRTDEFLLGEDYVPPTGIRKLMQIRVLSWPIYAYFMALGQIMAANSYQIILLTGEVGQTASKLYVLASIYLASSMCWWLLFRRFPSVLSLSLPFVFYGLAFFLIGVAIFATGNGRFWIQNLGTAFYAVASSSGALFFALNFGDEGGAHVKAWVFRACVIQGTQQIYVVALWYWGSVLTQRTVEGIVTTQDTIAGSWKITAITFPIGFALWIVAAIMFAGLPQYYRQVPGKMPSFYRSILKRKVVLWFFLTAVVQNFFMSAPYGRNWSFLFSSQHAKTWQVLCLVFAFFIFVWAGLLWLFGYLSKSHSWILPLFAIGLGAPRFAQIWWGTSNIGLYLPWAGGFTASALVSRTLWLWLGVLDAIQGVGLGMIMLGTLTRIHVAFAVISTQILGSIATIIARAVAPNRIGPGPISPDISGGVSTIWNAWFWIALFANLGLCVGFYKFYRKEQLLKP